MGIPHADTMYITVDYSLFTSLPNPIQTAIINAACESSIDTLRHTVSGTDRILLKFDKYSWKWKGSPPAILTNFSGQYDTFTYDEILVEMKKPEWDGTALLRTSSSSGI